MTGSAEVIKIAEKIPVTIRFDLEDYKIIENLAKDSGVQLADIVRMAVKSYFKQQQRSKSPERLTRDIEELERKLRELIRNAEISQDGALRALAVDLLERLLKLKNKVGGFEDEI